MKKLKLPFLITLLALGLCFVSCEKDKVSKENSFTFNNVVHKTTHGYLMIGTVTETTSGYGVLLCSEGLVMVQGSSPAGYGDVIIMVFVSDSPTEFLSGNYVFDSNLQMAQVVLGYDADLGEGVFYTLKSGEASSVKVNVSGDTYEFDYSLTLQTGKVLKGYYKGKLEEFTQTVSKSGKLYFFER